MPSTRRGKNSRKSTPTRAQNYERLSRLPAAKQKPYRQQIGRSLIYGAAAGTFLAPGIGTAAGGLAGMAIGEKKAFDKLNNTTGKGKSTKRTTTKSHKGVARAATGRKGTTKRTVKTTGHRGKKTNYVKDEHGRFAGSK